MRKILILLFLIVGVFGFSSMAFALTVPIDTAYDIPVSDLQTSSGYPYPMQDLRIYFPLGSGVVAGSIAAEINNVVASGTITVVDGADQEWKIVFDTPPDAGDVVNLSFGVADPSMIRFVTTFSQGIDLTQTDVDTFFQELLGVVASRNLPAAIMSVGLVVLPVALVVLGTILGVSLLIYVIRSYLR